MSKLWFYDKSYAAEEIRNRREMKGYTQERFGELLYWDRRKIWRLETGRYEPKPTELDQIAAVLGCNAQDFYKELLAEQERETEGNDNE